MTYTRRFAVALALAAALAARTAAATDLVFEFPNAWVQKPAYDRIIPAFEQLHPGTHVVLRPSPPSYDEALQRVLRDSIAGLLPDLSVQSLDNLRILVDRGLALPVDDLIGGEGDLAGQGYPDSVVALCRFAGRHYCLPTVLSLPAIFYNAELVKRAGGDPDRLPQGWDEIIALGAQIGAGNAAGSATPGMWIRYAPDSWIWQALVYSQGGAMLTEDERGVAFDDATGLRGLEIAHAIGARTGMPDLSYAQARQAFSAGGLGIMIASSAALQTLVQDVAGRFPIIVGPFPILAPSGHLPAGSDAPFILTRDPQKRRLAWEFAKFAVGPVGQTFMVRASGFMPTNDRALQHPALLGTLFAAEPNRMVTVRQRDRAVPWYSFPGENGLKINTVIVEEMRRVIVQGKPPAQALADMRRAVQKLLPPVP